MRPGTQTRKWSEIWGAASCVIVILLCVAALVHVGALLVGGACKGALVTIASAIVGGFAVALIFYWIEIHYDFSWTTVLVAGSLVAIAMSWTWFGLPTVLNGQLLRACQLTTASPFGVKVVYLDELARYQNRQIVWDGAVVTKEGVVMSVTTTMWFEIDGSRPEAIAAFSKKTPQREFIRGRLSEARQAEEGVHKRIVEAVMREPVAVAGKYNAVEGVDTAALAQEIEQVFVDLPFKLSTAEPLAVSVKLNRTTLKADDKTLFVP